LQASIEGVVETAIPNTSLTFRRFRVSYLLPDSPEVTIESDAPADRLRIKLPPGVSADDTDSILAGTSSGEQQEERASVNENTGYGGWSTVSVRVVDEEEEARALQEEQALNYAEEKKRKKSTEALDDPQYGDDALGAYNPWGGSYKGIKLGSDSSHADNDLMTETPRNPISFKKRKKNDKTKKLRSSITD